MANRGKSVWLRDSAAQGLIPWLFLTLLWSDHQFPDLFRFHGVSTVNFTLWILRGQLLVCHPRAPLVALGTANMLQ